VGVDEFRYLKLVFWLPRDFEKDFRKLDKEVERRINLVRGELSWKLEELQES